MRLICDFSFIYDYAENFFSDENRNSATIVNSAISQHIKGTPILVISYQTIGELNNIYGDRELMLDTIFGVCKKEDISICNRVDSLIKLAALYEIEDEDTYILAEDNYIINEINKTTHKAISIKEALKLLKEKSILQEIKSATENKLAK